MSSDLKHSWQTLPSQLQDITKPKPSSLQHTLSWLLTWAKVTQQTFSSTSLMLPLMPPIAFFATPLVLHYSHPLLLPTPYCHYWLSPWQFKPAPSSLNLSAATHKTCYKSSLSQFAKSLAIIYVTKISQFQNPSEHPRKDYSNITKSFSNYILPTITRPYFQVSYSPINLLQPI